MIIYELRNKINGKVYVGQHSANTFDTYWGSGLRIRRAIKKYGTSNFYKTILERCESKEHLDIREKYWIASKDSINRGYNLTIGGTGGDTSKYIKYSEESKHKLRESLRRYYRNLSESERLKRFDNIRGSKNGMSGKLGYWKNRNIPLYVIKKMLENRRSYAGESNPNFGKRWSLLKREQFSISQKATMNIPEVKEKLRKPKRDSTRMGKHDKHGNKNPFFNRKHTDSTKLKLRSVRLGKSPSNIKEICIGDKVFMGLQQASLVTGIKASTIWHRIHSKNVKYNDYRYLSN
jgi:group I intron endonuclease